MPAVPSRTWADCSRPGSPASSVTAGMPASVAARRSVPAAPGLCSTMKAPKPLANSRTLALRRSARSCGRLVRFSEPVWMSTSPSHWRMTSSKSDAAIRDAELPVALPGKYRFRSRRSGR